MQTLISLEVSYILFSLIFPMHLLPREAEKAWKGGLRPVVPTLGRLEEEGRSFKARTDDVREFKTSLSNGRPRN